MYNDGIGAGAAAQNPLAAHMASLDAEAGTITGRTEEECRKKLYDKFKTGYEIIGSKQILKGGFLGFGQKEFFEVKYVVKPRSLSFEQSRQQLLETISGNSGGGSGMSNKQFSSLAKKLEEMESALDRKISAISVGAQGSDHPTIQKIEELLVQNEFTQSYIAAMKARLKAEFSLEELDDFQSVQSRVVDWIGESIQIYPKTPMKAPHVIVLVGPTGVGKTTTIAKLAAMFNKEAKSKNIAKPKMRIITIDYTRVGAEAQSKRWGELLDVPVDKAESAEDVKKIFDAYKSEFDIFLIDTPGYSPNDFESIGRMCGVLGIPGMNKDVYLTVSASVKARDLLSIIQVYEQFNYDSVILTKFDETSAFGNILSVFSEKHKPIAYIGYGQKVATDFSRANVVKFLTNLNDFAIDREHIEEVFPTGNEQTTENL